MKLSDRKILRGVLIAAILVWVALAVVVRVVPLPRNLYAPPPLSLDLRDRNDLPLRQVLQGDKAQPERVAFHEIPEALVLATLAAEDKRFWQHRGIDWLASARAVWSWARNQRVTSGASTISQQLIKLTERRPRTLRTKIIENFQALRLEREWGKQRILTEYLNRLDYGNLCHGCASAAEFYFAKPLRDLTPAECAFLAGLPQSPTRLNPRQHLDRAVARQQWVLGRMLANGRITPAEFTRAKDEPLRFGSLHRTFRAPHFVDFLLQREQRGEMDLPAGRVVTTLDLALNQVAASALREHLAGLRAHNVRNGAVVVLDNRSGEVLALVGSDDYFSPFSGQVNGAWAPRSAGSAIKPFTYLLAFERGATPATVVADVPTEFATSTGGYRPANYDHRCNGPVRYREALANSLNIPAVKVLDSIGGPAVLQRRLQELGLTTLSKSADHYGLGLTIGNAEARLLELANAYACLARLGEFKPWSVLRESGGSVMKPQRLADSNSAYLVADILSDNRARALCFGLTSPLRFEFPVACKTGTSTDFRDNWAFGFTPEFTVGVWVGNFDGSPMQHVSGVAGAGPILHELFVHLHERFGTSWYPAPAEIVSRTVHPLTGKRLARSRPDAVTEKFPASNLPAFEEAGDYDAGGRVRLGVEYGEWFASGQNTLGDRAVIDAGASEQRALRLASPLPGTTYFIDPDRPRSRQRIPLRALGTGVQWQSETLRCYEEGGSHFADMTEGRHRLVLVRTGTGERLETWIQVKAL